MFDYELDALGFYRYWWSSSIWMDGRIRSHMRWWTYDPVWFKRRLEGMSQGYFNAAAAHDREVEF